MKGSDRRDAQAAAAEVGARRSGRDRWDIVLHNPNGYPEATARRLRPWLERLARSLVEVPEGEERSLGVRFVGDRAMQRANRQFRGKDGTTDVLSFPGEGEHLGDILVSVPTARRQAVRTGDPVERELQVLLLHGLLHCLGYDHETDDGTMERLERRLRRQWIDALTPVPSPASPSPLPGRGAPPHDPMNFPPLPARGQGEAGEGGQGGESLPGDGAPSQKTEGGESDA